MDSTGENKVYRYYSTMRPFGPGTFPKKDGRETITNFDGPEFCEEIGREAWGFIEYAEPLTEQEAAAYELISSEKKIWYCVTSSVDDRGRMIAAITDVCESAAQPENRFTHTARKDIYNDWYGSEAEAKQAVEEARKA